MLAKIYIGTFAALLWAAAIVGKHFWPDLSTAAFELACASVLSGLGIYHVAGAADAPKQDQTPVPAAPIAPAVAPPGQGGFASWPLLVIIFAILALAGSLQGCTATMLDNRVSCTVAHDKAFFVSEYGPVGIAATIADQDRAAICGAKP